MLKHIQAAFAIIFALFPLLGVWVWGWSAREVIILYWVENLIIGIWQVMKMLTLKKASQQSKISTSLFFTFHYGFFCFVHGVFIITLTSGGDAARGLPNPFLFFEILSQGGLLAVFSNMIMHGIRFYREHIQEGGRESQEIGRLMGEPYKHIIVIHVAIIASAAIVSHYESALPLLGLIVLGKLVLDLRSIYGSRKKADSGA